MFGRLSASFYLPYFQHKVGLLEHKPIKSQVPSIVFLYACQED